MATESVSDAGTTIESERLLRELAEARDQLDATARILKSIGRSASDFEGVLDAIVESTLKLCRADQAVICLINEGTFFVASATGLSDEYRDYIAGHPIIVDRTTAIGRVAIDRVAQQIEDVLTDPEYGRPDIQQLGGYRTVLGVPMVIDDEVVGVVNLWRSDVDPFSDRAIELVTTFAAQAAIALRNVDLVRALQARTTEMDEKVAQLEALRKVGQAVSSTLDLDEVLATIVKLAVQLTETDGGSLLELDHASRVFRIRAAYGSSSQLLEALRSTRIALDDTLVGLACLQGQPQMAADLETAHLDPHLAVLKGEGWRSVLAVPMQHEGEMVGALVVRRRSTGTFDADTSALLQTFASQSALAIVNARLFHELERKSAELQIASRHKSEFLANMSHELRTPLNAVIGFSEVLLERMFGDLNDKQEDYLRDILGSGRHLLELLNDILDLSKVEAGHMQLDRSDVGVTPVLEYCLAQVRERAGAHGISLHLDVGAEVDTVVTDELRLKQVLLNLLSNAVKFTGEAGGVTLRAHADEGELTISVSDTGPGIAPQDRERVFESFEQAGRPHDQTEGTGLGLALCRRIVDLLNGRLWLESEVGVGSTFAFTLPLDDASTRSSSHDGSRDGPVIVIIEDDRRSRELTSLYLEGAGARTVSTATGIAGLAAVRSHRPAAVVLDIRLPGMDGWEVLSTLKADPATSLTPVVVITMLDERLRAKTLGADEYLIKPVNREQVLEALGRVGVIDSSTRSAVSMQEGT
jgi:signal transduction histidine kinase/ActR/RegA family two-component response regulator